MVNMEITTKAAFRRFVKEVDISSIDWCMVGLATSARLPGGKKQVIDVQPIISFRSGDAKGTTAALKHVAEDQPFAYLLELAVSIDNAEFAERIDEVAGDTTRTLTSEYLEALVNDIFRWIPPAEYGDHANLAALAQMMQAGVPECKMPMHEYSYVVVFDQLDQPVKGRGQTILRLLARSKGWIPASCDLDVFEAGMFEPGNLKVKVVNTTEGPALHELWEQIRQTLLITRGYVPTVVSCDWFLRYWDYYLPEHLRFCTGAEGRLGGSVGNGDGSVDPEELPHEERAVILMNHGFFNFNSTAEGKNMLEGRLTSGMTAMKGAKFGGGASGMGTLEGIDERVVIGPGSLVGANGNAGISLGEESTIAAGCSPQAGQRIYPVCDENDPEFYERILAMRDPDRQYDGDDFVYGSDLSGADGVLISHHPTTMVVRPSSSARKLNEALYG